MGIAHYEWVSGGEPSGRPAPFVVLVVDDSPSIRGAVVAQACGTADFDGRRGERRTEKRRCDITLEQSAFDLVVSDVEMGAITGIQLCRVLRSDPGMTDHRVSSC